MPISPSGRIEHWSAVYPLRHVSLDRCISAMSDLVMVEVESSFPSGAGRVSSRRAHKPGADDNIGMDPIERASLRRVRSEDAEHWDLNADYVRCLDRISLNGDILAI